MQKIIKLEFDKESVSLSLLRASELARQANKIIKNKKIILNEILSTYCSS